MEPNEFECALCHEIYEKLITDEEADKEAASLFTQDEMTSGTEVICDDCWQELVPHLPKRT